MKKPFLSLLLLGCLSYTISYTQQTAFSNWRLVLPDLPDSLYVIADTCFRKGGTNRWLLGDHYRREWLTPVKVPVVLIDTLSGGAQVSREGGGKQTRSLRLSTDSVNKRELVIRSIEKFPDKALPSEFTGGAISYFLKDQISTAHPFGALVVAPLAEAGAIYHTNPRIVYIPSSPRLQNYDSLYGNRLYLLEERTRTNWSATSLFGGSQEVISTNKLFEKLHKNASNTVDEASFLRARLLDILIGDWDRHEEQWDWASFPSVDQTIYRPIPKDRDQAFVRLDGLAPWLGTRKWLLRRIKHFDYTIQDLEGLTWQARHLDRALLSTLSWPAWEKEVLFLQAVWTEEIIREAVRKLPPEHYAFSGPEIEKKLVRRRLDLHQYARRFYLSLAQEISWAGTNDRDEFVVDLVNDSVVVVSQNSLKKGLHSLVRERRFSTSETKAIQLYGREDDDVFRVKGEGRPGINIRWIGSEGTDTYTDSTMAWAPLPVLVYDTVSRHQRSHLGRLRVYRRYDSNTHRYNYLNFEYSRSTPLFLPAFNVDDGLVFGSGLKWQKRGWGHSPFAQEHRLTANYALRTNAYQFTFDGLFSKALGRWDLIIRAALRQPGYILNFYGLGNNTEREVTRRNFYNVRVRQVLSSVGLQRIIDHKQNFLVATELSSGKIEPNEERFVKMSNPVFDSADFQRVTWYGLSGTYRFSSRDNVIYPTSGIQGSNTIRYHRMAGSNRWYLHNNLELSFFLTIGRLTFASRLGGATVRGEPQFFQYATLGGLENLRGYRRTRFSGKSALYYNQELRLPLTDIKGYFFRGRAGLLAFSDQGRVWHPGEFSSRWHWGHGGGIWFMPYGRYSFTVTYAQSHEDKLVVIRSGFLF